MTEQLTQESIRPTEPVLALDSQQRREPLLTIRRSSGWSTLRLRDVWEYRELLLFLVWRDIQSHYRQTALGMTWLILRPIVNVFVLSVVFGRFLNVPSEGVPYPLFSLAAMLPWSYFSNSVSRATHSLIGNMHVISKIFFPRLIIPLSATLSGLVDFAATFVIFILAILVFDFPLRWSMLAMPLFLLLAMGFALGVGLWLATLAVKYRDVQFALGFMLQVLMYASPVIYSTTLVPEALQPVYNLNPMTGVIEGFRWAFLGIGQPPGGMFVVQWAIVLVLMVSGAYVFRRTERTVVDIL